MAGFDQKTWARGRLDRLDKIEHGDPTIAKAISAYSDALLNDRQGNMWMRVTNWVENLLFGLGHHYVRDVISSRLATDANGSNSELVADTIRKIPKPTNDFLGRYIETNISLLTENRPEPRITAKSDDRLDKQAAELGQFTIQYLWEHLNLPEKSRDLARLVLYTGTAWLETCYDPCQVRHMTVPQTSSEQAAIAGTNGPISLPVDVDVPILDKQGRPKTSNVLEFGDITSTVVSGFEMYFPSTTQGWNSEQMGWVMREYYAPVDSIKDKYGDQRIKKVMTKANGWFIDSLKNLKGTNVYNLPLWWWERLCDAVEGPGPSVFVGSKDHWDDFAIVRIFDRKPNPIWPNGRTVITVNDVLLYDSPKKVGARAFNPRWPDRWHPYTRFRWQAQSGSTYGRSLVSQLLPKLKRVNAIDTTLIMWRRTVPIAAWIMPRGCFFPNESKYLRDNGTVERIEAAIKGELVQSFNTLKPILELQKYENDEKIVALYGKGVPVIKGTFGHKVPVFRKEDVVFRGREKSDTTKVKDVALGTIRKGDYVLSSFTRRREVEKLDISKFITPSQTKIKLPQYISLDAKFLRLAGLYLAEGSLIKYTNSGKQLYNGLKLTFGSHEIDTLAKESSDLLTELFGVKPKTFIEIDKHNHSRCIVSVHNKDLSALFDKLFGHGAKNKVIHDDIFFAAGSLLPLVGGWFDGDGCYHQPQKNKTWRMLTGSSISENLINQLRGILLDEKIWCNLNSNIKGRNNEKFVLNINSSYLNKLQPYCNKIDKVEYKKTCEQGFWIGNIYFTKVKKVAFEDYKGPVYDLSIKDKHYYQVNGVIVHNTAPVEGQILGRPGTHIQYDPRQSNGNEPKPVFPPEYPRTAIEERSTQISEMEAIAGTEEILRGERPQGVNSASMLNVLRKQALASRSAIIQTWDESLQNVGSALLQEVSSHIKDDPRYAQRIKILAREKGSSFAVERFSGTDISDNVIVRVDTASQAMVSREAKQQMAIEVLQYAPGLMQLPATLQAKIMDALGWSDALTPKGPDISRAQTIIGFLKSNRFELCMPFPEDDAYVLHEFLVEQLKKEETFDWSREQVTKLDELIKYYYAEIMKIEMDKIQMQNQLAMQQSQAVAAGEGE